MARDGDFDKTVSGDSSERVREVIADCLRRRAAGETVPDQSIIDAHPDLMPDLADELRKLRLVEAAWEEAADGRPHDGDTETLGPAGLHIRCPHCHNPVEIVVDTPLTDIACSACGSHFNLVEDDSIYTTPAVKTIGHFETIEHLGTGAFGAVWKARDIELDRTVALKIPRKGQLTAAETQQFLREARAAAQLRHPNIVSVHEVGREGDTLYIVSDLVRGVSLSDWLTTRRLSSREVAELCAKIAEALHHAHEAGVIHRDLKPSNIMMDTTGEPHIMDFGLAKREAGEITVTMDGRPLGTPAYMSPEQAQGQAHLATGRSDVYSLGVIFFELLTGELPFRGNTRMLVHQVIHDEAPSPRKLNSSIPRDLETICLKCLEKESSRRYPTAEVLADELHRFLRGEPIHARPVSAPAHLWRWCKRKPLVAALTAGVVVALLAGTGVSSYFSVEAGAQAQEALDQRALADTKAEVAEKARQEEARYRGLAEAERQEALDNFDTALEAVDNFFIKTSENPQLKAQGQEALRHSLLGSARKFYDELLVKPRPTDPARLAEVGLAYGTLGMINKQVGLPDDAEDALQNKRKIFAGLVVRCPAVHEYRYDLAAAHLHLGKLYEATDRFEKAQTSYETARGIFQRLTVKHPDVPQYWQSFGHSYNDLGLLLEKAGRAIEAEREYQAALRIRERLVAENPDVAKYQNDLGVIHLNMGLFYLVTGSAAKAEASLMKALKVQGPLAALPLEVPEYVNTLAFIHYNLGLLHQRGKQLAQARAAYGAAMKIYEHLTAVHPRVPQYHLDLAKTCFNLARVYRLEGKPDDSVAMLQKTVALQKRFVAAFPTVPGYKHDLAMSYHNLGALYWMTHRFTMADAAYDAAISILERLAAEAEHVTSYSATLGGVYCSKGILLCRRGEPQAALHWYGKAVRRLGKLLQREPRLTEARLALGRTYSGRAEAYAMLKRHAEAVAQYSEALKLTEGPARNAVRMFRAMALAHSGDHARAAAEAEAVASANEGDGEALNAVAYIFVRAAHAAGRDESLTERNRARLAEQYAARAIALLAKAQATGLFNGASGVRRLMTDPRLAPLRDRDDFKKLTRSVTSKETSSPGKP